MSGDKEQEYFSDGLSEELLNDLSRIKELQVAARTSAFSFKGKDANIGTIARELNVGAILEGSVRRSGHTVRITAQLNNAMTGFRLWSQTYDRSVGDVLQLQTEIANAVVSALRVTLLGDEAAKIEEGGTRNAAALDAFLRATRLYWEQTSAKDAHAAVNGYTEAIRLDPEYASAYAARSLASQNIVGNWATSISVIRARQEAAKADARKAITLAPNLSEAHLALAAAYASLLEFRAAIEEFERALALAPGNARVLRDYGRFAVSMGRSNSGINSLRRAVVLDPLNAISYTDLASRLYLLRRYQESLAVTKEGASVTNLPGGLSETIGLFYYYLGDFESARSSCEKKTAFETLAQLCLALTYEKLGRHADAEAMLAKARASVGDAGAYYYAANHAQWGDAPQALKWLDQALRLRDPNLVDLKMDPAFDPVRKEPRFQAIERALKFPE
jgi:serine/threonine-protein kinase